MASTIRMDTEKARSTAMLLTTNAGRLDTVIDKMNISIRRLNASWEGGASDSFCAQLNFLKRNLEKKAWELSNLSQQLRHEIEEWEIADQRLQGDAWKKKMALFSSQALAGATGAVVQMASGSGEGEVLGVSTQTSEATAKTYQQMSWSDKFAEEAAINAQIGELEQQLYNLPADRAMALEQIDKDIAHWEEMKTKYEAESRKIFNNLPGNLQGDSASDIYKDLAKDADAMLAKLFDRKELLQSDAYVAQRQTEINSQITNLKAQQATLNEVINAGIPPSGPTKGISLAGCAKFVAEKKDISSFAVPGDMNAARWDDHALAAGLEVGSRPVPGSIMVIDHNNSVFSKIDEVGHVVFVEKVTRVEGGYQVTYSEASTPRNANGKWTGSYTYVNPRTKSIKIPDGCNGINFIYD